jgi:predicted PurR-regulated permease PerM
MKNQAGRFVEVRLAVLLAVVLIVVVAFGVFVFVFIDQLGDLNRQLNKANSDLDRARQMNVDFIQERDRLLGQIERLRGKKN